MAKPVRTFNQSLGDESNPAPLKTDLDSIIVMFDPEEEDGGIGTENIQDGAITTPLVADGAITAAKVGTDVATQAELDAHTGNTSNPHSVTAAQIGAESEAGAQAKVDAHANLINNPHSVTAAQVGAITDINDVENAGGGIDLVGGTGITITPDGDGKQITITATGEATPGAHAAEHATAGSDPISPASIGAATSGHTHNNAVSGGASGFMTGSDKAKLDGVEPGATADMSADEILTAVKTVDGSGSGLDADLLDGSEGSAFVKTTGATMSGVLTCRNSTDYTTKQARNVTLSTENPSGGGNGDIWFKYA